MAELNQCDWGVYQEKNPKVATEIQTPKKQDSTPQARCQVLSLLQGVLLEVLLCPPNYMFPIFSPLGFMGLAHESRLEYFFNIYSINLLEFK